MTQVTHSEIAISFLKLAAAGKVREAYSKYVSLDFRHHNPFFRGDRESLMLAMEENWTKNPDKKLEIKLTLEDRDMAVTLLPCAAKQRRSRGSCCSYFQAQGWPDRRIVGCRPGDPTGFCQ